MLECGVYGMLLYDDTLEESFSTLSFSMLADSNVLLSSVDVDGPICAWPWYDQSSLKVEKVELCQYWARYVCLCLGAET